MSLLRRVGRTAVIAATVSSVSNRTARKQQGRWAAQAQAAEAQQAATQPVPEPAVVSPSEAAPPAATFMSDRLAQLQQLGELKAQGILTDEEFDAQKKQILGA